MKLTGFLLFFTLSVSSFAQEGEVTTVILVRHAEKADDGTKDPDLSEQGRARADAFASLFGETEITAIYSTDYKRTRNTVSPLATKKGLTIRSYPPLDAAAIKRMTEEHAGGTLVVCGHSNTIPAIANQLVGMSAFRDFDESDYGNILVVTLAKGLGPRVLRLRY